MLDEQLLIILEYRDFHRIGATVTVRTRNLCIQPGGRGHIYREMVCAPEPVVIAEFSINEIISTFHETAFVTATGMCRGRNSLFHDATIGGASSLPTYSNF